MVMTPEEFNRLTSEQQQQQLQQMRTDVSAVLKDVFGIDAADTTKYKDIREAINAGAGEVVKMLNASKEKGAPSIEFEGLTPALLQVFAEKIEAFKQKQSIFVSGGNVFEALRNDDSVAIRNLKANKDMPEFFKDHKKLVQFIDSAPDLIKKMEIVYVDAERKAAPPVSAPVAPVAPAAPAPGGGAVPQPIILPDDVIDALNASVSSAQPDGVRGAITPEDVAGFFDPRKSLDEREAGPVSTPSAPAAGAGGTAAVEKTPEEKASKFTEEHLHMFAAAIGQMAKKSGVPIKIEAEFPGTPDGIFDAQSDKSLQKTLQILRSKYVLDIPGDKPWLYTPAVGEEIKKKLKNLNLIEGMTEEQRKELRDILGDGTDLVNNLNILHASKKIGTEQLVSDTPFQLEGMYSGILGWLVGFIREYIPQVLPFIDGLVTQVTGASIDQLLGKDKDKKPSADQSAEPQKPTVVKVDPKLGDIDGTEDDFPGRTGINADDVAIIFQDQKKYVEADSHQPLVFKGTDGKPYIGGISLRENIFTIKEIRRDQIEDYIASKKIPDIKGEMSQEQADEILAMRVAVEGELIEKFDECRLMKENYPRKPGDIFVSFAERASQALPFAELQARINDRVGPAKARAEEAAKPAGTTPKSGSDMGVSKMPGGNWNSPSGKSNLPVGESNSPKGSTRPVGNDQSTPEKKLGGITQKFRYAHDNAPDVRQLEGEPLVSVDQNKQLRITYLEKGQVKELNVTEEMNKPPLERMRGPKTGESGEEYRAYRAGKMAEIEAYYPRLSEISKNYPQYASGAIDLMAHVGRHSGNIQSQQPRVNDDNGHFLGVFRSHRHQDHFKNPITGKSSAEQYKESRQRIKTEHEEFRRERVSFRDNADQMTAEKPAPATVPDDSLVTLKPDSVGFKVT